MHILSVVLKVSPSDNLTILSFYYEKALERICDESADAIQGSFGDKGVSGVILSDRFAGPDRMALPSLLAVGAVHQHLLKTKQRPKAAIFAEAGDCKEVHDFATMFGFGCDGVCPYMAYESICKMNAEGMVEAKAKREYTDDELYNNYRNAAAKGLLKVMSKMGISTLQSYKAAQVFEAVGLADEVVDRCFTGTTTRIQGTDFEALYRDMEKFHEAAYPIHESFDTHMLVQSDGQFHFRDGGEAHRKQHQWLLAHFGPELGVDQHHADAYSDREVCGIEVVIEGCSAHHHERSKDHPDQQKSACNDGRFGRVFVTRRLSSRPREVPHSQRRDADPGHNRKPNLANPQIKGHVFDGEAVAENMVFEEVS